MKIGLIVNPIAGMGGKVGLKGTDGNLYEKAIALGATPISANRTIEFLNSIHLYDKFTFLVPNGVMGEYVIRQSKIKNYLIINCAHDNFSTNKFDTINCAKLISGQVDVLVFSGGDGTARDIYDAIKESIPVIGIPSGVKMYSAIFAKSPKDAAITLEDYYYKNADIKLKEILDIDEDEYRKNKLSIRLYGYIKSFSAEGMISSGKQAFFSIDEDEIEGISNYLKELINPEFIYIVGPGSTTYYVFKKIGIEKTLLGVDIIKNNKIIKSDANEKDILISLSNERSKIIVTPIGGQGFLFGRGNQQISSEVIRLVGKENIIVISTKSKISSLKYLLVDTGDPKVNEMLKGYIKIIIGYRQEKIMKIV
jgi:predicted polyphosphate/ATP-dependent NAD kinase